MEKKILKRHKRNKAELAVIDRTLDRLYEQLEDVEEVSGKVTKSSDDFPYIEEHMTVRMADPKKADPIKARIRVREARKAKTNWFCCVGLAICWINWTNSQIVSPTLLSAF